MKSAIFCILKLGKLSEVAALEELERLSGKLVEKWFEAMEVEQMRSQDIDKVFQEYEYMISQALILYAGNMSSEMVNEMALKELNEACYNGGAISPLLRSALGLEETTELCQIECAIWWLKTYGLEKTVKSYHTGKAIGQLKAIVEDTEGSYTEQIITLLMEEFQKPYATEYGRYPRPAKSMFVERYYLSNHPKLLTIPFANSSHGGYPRSSAFANGYPASELLEIKIGHHKNDVVEIPKSATTAFAIYHDTYAQSSTPANDVPFVHAQNLDESVFEENDDVPKKHFANIVAEALRVPDVMLEGNQIFVTSLSQLAAVGMISSGSVDSWLLTFFCIAAVTGFLGCLWAMYLQKNQTYTKWLSKIGAVISTCAIIVALSMNFANEKNFTSFFMVVTLACIMSGALIMRS